MTAKTGQREQKSRGQEREDMTAGKDKCDSTSETSPTGQVSLKGHPGQDRKDMP
jgi:hypothetical protein